MKLGTKISILLLLLSLIPSVVLAKDFINAFQFDKGVLQFKFEVKTILGAVFLLISIILFLVIFYKIILSFSFENIIFISTVPIVAIYIVLLYFFTNIDKFNNNFVTYIKENFINIFKNNSYNILFWVCVSSLFFIFVLYLNYYFLCRPMKKIEKTVYRLGDGGVKEKRFYIGKGKHFERIEQDLNKINNTIKQSYYNDKVTLKNKKIFTRSLRKILNKNNIQSLCDDGKTNVKICLLAIKFDFDANQYDYEKSKGHAGYDKIKKLLKKSSAFVLDTHDDIIKCVFISSDDAVAFMHKNYKTMMRIFHIKDGSHISMILIKTMAKFVIDENNKVKTVIDADKLLDKMFEIAHFFKVNMLLTKDILDSISLKLKVHYRYVGKMKVDDKDISLYDDFSCKNKKFKIKMLRNKNIFEEGIKLYEMKNYNKAYYNFNHCVKSVLNDKISEIYLKKINKKLQNL